MLLRTPAEFDERTVAALRLHEDGCFDRACMLSLSQFSVRVHALLGKGGLLRIGLHVCRGILVLLAPRVLPKRLRLLQCRLMSLRKQASPLSKLANELLGLCQCRLKAHARTRWDCVARARLAGAGGALIAAGSQRPPTLRFFGGGICLREI